MRLATLVWGALFVAAAVVVLAGWFPGAASASTGPRIGIGMALATFGLLVVGIPATVAIVRRTTRPEDYAGGCPVGAQCGCGRFNFKPRRKCPACGQAMQYPA